MKRLFAGGLVVSLLFRAAPVHAQQPVLPDTVAVDSSRITPGKAFYRSLLVPGWGQASVGAYVRGGTFFAIQATSGWMLAKTIMRLGSARDVEDRLVGAARDSLNALMQRDTAAARRLADAVAFEAAIDTVENVRRARGLVNSRRQQRQDWITYTLVSTLASGVDAFVAAHLSDFPAGIAATPRAGGGLELQLKVRSR